MSTQKKDKHLDDYGIFVKNDPSKNTDSDDKLDSLQSPEEDIQAFGDFVKPKKDGLLRRAEALRRKKEDELPLVGDFEAPKSQEPATEQAAETAETAESAETAEAPQIEEAVVPQTAQAEAPAAPQPEAAAQTAEAPRPQPALSQPFVPPHSETIQKPAASGAENETPHTKVNRPIGVKLILIISLLVLFSMGIITILVSYFISKDTRINAEDNNLTINSRTASDCQSRLNSVISSAGILYDILISDSEEESREHVVNSFFERNKFIAAVSFKDLDSISYNRQFFASNEIEQSLFEAYVVQESEAVAESRQGSVKLLNASPFFGAQTIAIFTPVYSGTQSDSAVILFACDELSESFANSSINASTLVNDEGIVLIAPDIQQILGASDMSKNQLVAAMLDSKNNNEQFVYKDEEGTEYIAAFRKLGLGGCGVVTEVRTEIILEAVNATTRRNLYLTVSILSLAVILIWFFSKSLSSPLKTLTEVANEINRGNFNTEKFEELSANRKDEIGILIQSTKNEREILNTVTSLTNRGVTQAIVRKEIDFEPHLKDITIFFSDIRGFTAISDGFNKRFGEKSAAEIISFLNDYMSRMVNCINITGGNVDKFEGDAIMACWGVLRDDDLSFENLPDGDPEKEEHRSLHEEHVQADALSAIRATVAMRYALMEYNKQAEIFTQAHADEPYAKYKPHIRIGSGLNSGRATVGFMGSYHKMEFTSIGDAVNLASRTESSNKPCGTDILITQDTYDLLKYNYIRCAENNYTISPEHLANEVIVEMIPVAFEVKGKGKQHFYGVVNMPGFDIEGFFRQSEPDFKLDPDCIRAVGPDGPKTLHEVRSLLGIPEPNFDEVDLDAAEEKTKASGK